MKQLLFLKKFEKVAKKTYDAHSDIVDIIIFGSTMRGKSHPQDRDILIIFNRKVDRTVLKEYEVISKMYTDFFTTFPTQSILGEGYSVIFKKSVQELYGMISAYLFRYSLKGKSAVKRTQFYHALYERKTKGVVNRMNKEMVKGIAGQINKGKSKEINEGMLLLTHNKKFSDTTILTPIAYADQIRAFFESVQVSYFVLPILYPKTYEHAEKLTSD